MTALQFQQNIQQRKAVRTVRYGHQNAFTRRHKPVLPMARWTAFIRCRAAYFMDLQDMNRLADQKSSFAG
ncbi:MAG: hypothetical protein JRG73_07110 [Deltaproteobacteria bacterium]|nr:hypothetical protein [Deltaproteobacteria bacterium]